MKFILFSSLTLFVATCAAKVDIKEEPELMFPDDPSDDIEEEQEELELMFLDDPSDDFEEEQEDPELMFTNELLDDIEEELEPMFPDNLYLGLAEEDNEEPKMIVVSDEESEIKKIDPTSCKRGKKACTVIGKNKAVIGANSCNDSKFQSCSVMSYGAGTSVIGDGSCNGGYRNCIGNGYRGDGSIGNNSCNATGRKICMYNGYWGRSKGKIGNNACNANNACNRNRGVIASGCCNYPGACNKNRGKILPGTKRCHGSTKGNIRVGYYDATHWWRLEDFSKLTPYKLDMVRDINFNKQSGQFATSGRGDRVAALFQGTIRFPRSGIYTLCLTSDDGGKLYMNGVTKATIDVDGLHPPEEKCQRYRVTRRRVSFKIEFFEKAEDATLILKWIVPRGKAKVVVPASAYV